MIAGVRKPAKAGLKGIGLLLDSIGSGQSALWGCKASLDLTTEEGSASHPWKLVHRFLDTPRPDPDEATQPAREPSPAWKTQMRTVGPLLRKGTYWGRYHAPSLICPC